MAATLTYNNPGAIYPGASATLFGSTGFGIIGGGNQIAQFPDPVSGASAMFNLLGTNYQGMTLQDAITKWSGGNSSPAYAQTVSQQTGIALNQPLTSDLLSGPQGVSLAQSMSKWETGSAFPLTSSQWQQAQTAGLSGTPSTAGASVSATTGASAIGAGDWIANYFGRAVVIILGFIFVNSGLHMFGAGVPLAPVAARAIPAKRQRISMSHSGMPATVKLEGGPAPDAGAERQRRIGWLINRE